MDPCGAAFVWRVREDTGLTAQVSSRANCDHRSALVERVVVADLEGVIVADSATITFFVAELFHFHHFGVAAQCSSHWTVVPLDIRSLQRLSMEPACRGRLL